jgi:hypothetical protein
LAFAPSSAVVPDTPESNLDDQKEQAAQARQEAQPANDQIGALEDQFDDLSGRSTKRGDQLARPGDAARDNIDDRVRLSAGGAS